MDAEKQTWQHSRRWIILITIIILLITLYFYDPFTTYLVAGVQNIRFGNIVFWFASLVGVVGFAIGHWNSFRRNIFQAPGAANVEGLVFESLQITLMTAVIFCAGGTLQGVEIMSEYLLARGDIIDAAFGSKILTIILLVILTIIFYLLHMLVRLFRQGWSPRRPGQSSRSAPVPARPKPSS